MDTKLLEAVNYLNEHIEEQTQMIQELMNYMEQMEKNKENLTDEDVKGLTLIINNMRGQDRLLKELEPEEALLSVVRSFALCSGMVIAFGEYLPNLSALVEMVSKLINGIMEMDS